MTSSKPGRLIPGGPLTSDLVTWEAPAVENPSMAEPADPEVELQAMRELVREQAYTEGHAAGMAAAQTEIAAQAEALDFTLRALARPLERLDHQVEEEILALVQAIARQLVRRELKMDPGEVISVIRAGLDALPVASDEVVVRLHPADAQLVRELLKPADGESPWRLQSDPMVERGGCQIITSTSQVDGRLETRLGRVIASLLDDARSEERSDDD